MQSQVQPAFSAYHERLLASLQAHLDQLLSVPRNPSHEQHHSALVSGVLNLFNEFYALKWGETREGILGLFDSTWLTPLDKAGEWMTAWRPSSSLKVISSLSQVESFSSLSEHQLRKIEMVRMRTGVEEEKLERKLHKHQVSLSVNVRMKSVADGGGSFVDGLEKVMKAADSLRMNTMKELLHLLTPLQFVDYMTEFLMSQTKLGKGKRRSEAGGCSEFRQ